MSFRKPSSRPQARGLWLVLGLIGWCACAWAHSPFDNSVHATLYESELEVSIVLGTDAARLFVQKAAPDQINKLGGMGAKPLPPDLAAELAELTSDGAPVHATSLQVMGDGLEYSFVARYPRPAGGALTFKAKYHALAPDSMRLGTFVLADEMGRQLGSGLVTHDNSPIELNIPSGTAAIPASATPAPAATGLERAVVTSPPTSVSTQISFVEFLWLGIEHILTGYDHLLFLCALLVACDRVKPMIGIITCFTLAHSLTLALAALDLVSVSPRLVEPLIAASIVYVGLENFRGKIDFRNRCLVTLGFGLIHGFGFAGVLRESGLAERGVAMAKPLFAFNLGVELGQLAVASVFLPLLFLARRLPQFARHGTAGISACVVALGGVWLVERLLG